MRVFVQLVRSPFVLDRPKGDSSGLNIAQLIQKSATRPMPAEKRFAQAYKDTTSVVSRMASSFQPCLRSSSASDFSTSAGWRESLSAKRNSAITLGSTGAVV